jgi:hypothetical protein
MWGGIERATCMLIIWENSSPFLSWHVWRENFLSEFHCIFFSTIL